MAVSKNMRKNLYRFALIFAAWKVIQPEKLLKLIKRIEMHLESDYVATTWNQDEKNGVFMIRCCIIGEIGIGAI